MLLLNNIIILRNFGEDKEELRGRHRGGEHQQGCPRQVGCPIHIKFDRAHLEFQESCVLNHFLGHIYTLIYICTKGNKINFEMAPVLSQNSFGFNDNQQNK